MHANETTPSAISATQMLRRVCPNRLGAGLIVSLAGWTTLWASALHVIAFPPPWLGGVLFFAGLALIPLAQSASRGRRSRDELKWESKP